MNDPARQSLLRRLPAIGGIAAAGGTALWLGHDGGRIAVRVAAMGGIIGLDGPSLIAGGAAIAGAVVWAALYLLWGPAGWLDMPRRRSARRPLSYADLGPPPPREQPLPTDLDQPLSAYDPEALIPGVRRRT